MVFFDSFVFFFLRSKNKTANTMFDKNSAKSLNFLHEQRMRCNCVLSRYGCWLGSIRSLNSNFSKLLQTRQKSILTQEERTKAALLNQWAAKFVQKSRETFQDVTIFRYLDKTAMCNPRSLGRMWPSLGFRCSWSILYRVSQKSRTI